MARRLSWCISNVPVECAVETYGPNAPVFSRDAVADSLIKSLTVTGGPTCGAIVGAAFADFMVEGEPQATTPARDSITPHMGAHITGDGYDVVFIATSTGTGREMVLTILHEAAYHEGYESHWAADAAAAACLQDEEEDDPGPGDPGTTETCTDVEHPPLTATIPVFVPTGDCGDNSVEADSCENGICTGYRLNICPGRWVDQEVVLREGYTERVCTSN